MILKLNSMPAAGMFIFFAAALVSGCYSSVDDYRNEIYERLRKSDGVNVDFVIDDIRYFSADLIDWAGDRGVSGARAMFAKVDTANGCYILGPGISVGSHAGARFKGVVVLDLIYDWPIEVFSVYPSCLPVDGEIFSSINVIISPPRDIVRRPKGGG